MLKVRYADTIEDQGGGCEGAAERNIADPKPDGVLYCIMRFTIRQRKPIMNRTSCPAFHHVCRSSDLTRADPAMPNWADSIAFLPCSPNGDV